MDQTNKCFVCENCLGNTFSLCLKKDGKKYHTCSYDCNIEMKDEFGEDYWEYVINKTDFITPLSGPFTNPFIIKENQKINKSIFDSNLYNFTEDEQFINPERYESQYEIYLENKRIDQIFDESDNSSNYSYGSE